MRAYELQDGGLDTMDANMMLGFDDDERDYGVAARMLRMIGARRVQLLTNNPGKLEALNVGGVEVTARVPLHTAINPENRRYLATKAARAGHWLEDMLEAGEPVATRSARRHSRGGSVPCPMIDVIARLDRAIQYSRPVFTGSPGQAGR